MIKDTLPNKSGNPGSLKKLIKAVGKLFFKNCAHSWREFVKGVLQVVLFTALCSKRSVKKHCVAKILQGIRERLLHDYNPDYNSYKFSYKFTFIPFLSLAQVGGLATRNSFAFCL